MPKCEICGRELKLINNNHLKTHGTTLEEYVKKYGDPNFKAGGKKRKAKASTRAIKAKIENASQYSAQRQKLISELYSNDLTLTYPHYANLVLKSDDDWEQKLNGLVLDINKHKYLFIDMAVSGRDPLDDDIIGLALCTGGTGTYRSHYIPLGHIDPKTESPHLGQFELADIVDIFKDVINDPNIKKAYHNAVSKICFLTNAGFDPKGLDWDTRTAMHILNENEPSFWVKDLVVKYQEKEPHKFPFIVEFELYDESVGGVKDKINTKYAPLRTASALICKENICNRLLYEYQKPYLVELRSLYDVYNKIEIPLIPVLVDMRMTGIQACRDTAKTLMEEYTAELEQARIDLKNTFGDINFNSPKQLGGVLFDELGFPEIEKRSVKKSVLEDLMEIDHPQAPMLEKILVNRGHEKLIGTYLVDLDRYITRKTGKVHCVFDPMGARTSRFSSYNPNLQNIPARDPKKARARRVYHADPGEVLISCDYSQVEPRLVASVSGDEVLIQSFLNGMDMYTEMAMVIFDKTREECGDGSKWRKLMKTLWLGILYGMSDKGLASRLGVSVKDARGIINSFYAEFRGIGTLVDKLNTFCRSNGYVTTINGRKRRLPDIWSDQWFIVNAVKRKILNSVIQGSAAEVMKQGMINCWYDDRVRDHGGRLLLTVHDELIISCPRQSAIHVARLVEEDMILVEKQFKLKVPLKCDSSIYLDGHWNSEYVIDLSDIDNGTIKESDIEWRVA